MSAYEALPADPKYLEFIKKMPADSNLVAQEAGLKAMLGFLRASSDDIVVKARNATLSTLVEKCLSSNRQGTKANAMEILFEMADVETAPIQEALIQGLSQKQPKAVASCVAMLKEMIKAYGPKTVELKPLMKVLVQIFGHSDKAVRSEGLALTVEIYKWAGNVFDSVFKDLKPVQVTEIQDAFGATQEKGKQTRYLRSQRPSEDEEVCEGTAEGEANGDVEEEQEESKIDPNDLLEPVDVLSKVPKNTIDLLNSSKWKERKEALDELDKVLDQPKYEKGDFFPLVQILGKKVNDVNLVVALAAIQCLFRIMKGLSKEFVSYKQLVLTPLLEKSKEKKTNFQQLIRQCLDELFKICGLKAVEDDVIEFCKNKNPQVRQESLLYLSRCVLDTTPRVDNKNFLPLAMKALDDSFPEIRDAGMQLIAALMIRSDAKIDKIDSIKQQKIQEYYDEWIKTRKKSAPPKPKQPAAAQKPASRPGTAKSTSSKSVTSSAASSKKNTPTLTRKPTSNVLKKPGSAGPSAPETKTVDVNDQQLALIEKLANADWKVRKESIDKLTDLVGSGQFAVMNDLIAMLKQRLAQETNKNLLLLLLELVNKISANDSNLIVKMLLKDLIPCLNDNKQMIKDKCNQVLQTLFESGKLGLATVLPFLSSEFTSVRKELLALLDKVGISQEDILVLEPTLIQMSEDKSPEIRKLCQQLLSKKESLPDMLKKKDKKLTLKVDACISSLGKELIPEFVDFLIESSCNINDQQFVSFFKIVGTNQELLLKMQSIYPTSKLLSHLIKEYNAKKDRKLLDHVFVVIERNHMINSELMKFLDDLDEEGRLFVDRKFKLQNAPVNNENEEPQAPLVPPVQPSPVKAAPAAVQTAPSIPKLDFDELQLPSLSSYSTSQVLTNQKSENYLMDYILTQITSGDMVQSVDALKQLEKQITSSPSKEFLFSYLNPLVNSITLQIRLVFISNNNRTSDYQRLLKHLINVLVLMLNENELCVRLSRDTLNQLITELATRLVDQNAQDQLNRAFNVLMLKVLEKCPKNTVISVLFDLLEVGVSSLGSSLTSDFDTRVKFSELIMKCLWKLTKGLEEALKTNQVDLYDLLYDIHLFLVSTGPHDWKVRQQMGLPLGDLPLRTVKTMLHEIVKKEGEHAIRVFESGDKIKDAKSSVVHQYLRQMFAQ